MEEGDEGDDDDDDDDEENRGDNTGKLQGKDK